MSSIYELTGDYLTLLDMLEDGEIDAQTILDTLEGINGELESKVDSYGVVRQRLLNEIDALKHEEKRLAERRKVMESNVDKLQGTLFQVMKATRKEKIKTPYFSFTISKTPPSLVLDDPSNIPSQFLIEQEPKIDARAIKELLKTQDVDFAHLEQRETLRVR